MHGGNLRWAKERYHLDDFLDLSANINPFGPPAGVFTRLREALPQIVHYPDPESKALRLKISQLTCLPYEMTLAGNGAGELIYTVSQALRPHKVMIPLPAFSEYERAAASVSAEIAYVQLGAEGWRTLPACDIPERAQAVEESWLEILKGTDLLFLCSPHNPTGTLLSPEGFAAIMRAASRTGAQVIFDESFYDFLPDSRRWSAREYLQAFPNLLVLHSLTKFYSLPGLRLGALFAQPELIRALEDVRDRWSVNALAQEAGLAALEDEDFPSQVRQSLEESKAFFYASFNEASFKHWHLKPSEANFALIEITAGTAPELTDLLGQRGILVRDCSSFAGLEGEFIRVAIKDKESMAKLIAALKVIEAESHD